MPNAPGQTSTQRDLFRGALEMHGYALVQHIKERSNQLLQVEEGSLYPALQRMLKEKLVRAEWQLSPTNRRVRTFLTAARNRPGQKLLNLREVAMNFLRELAWVSSLAQAGLH